MALARGEDSPLSEAGAMLFVEHFALIRGLLTKPSPAESLREKPKRKRKSDATE